MTTIRKTDLIARLDMAIADQREKIARLDAKRASLFASYERAREKAIKDAHTLPEAQAYGLWGRVYAIQAELAEQAARSRFATFRAYDLAAARHISAELDMDDLALAILQKTHVADQVCMAARGRPCVDMADPSDLADALITHLADQWTLVTPHPAGLPAPLTAQQRQFLRY